LEIEDVDLFARDRTDHDAFESACEKGHDRVVAAFLTREGFVPSEPALLFAIKGDHVDVVRRICSCIRSNNNSSPLCQAAMSESTLSLSALLETKLFKINALGQDRLAPLHHAIKASSVVAVSALLSYPGIDVNIVGENGATPLHVAASVGQIDILKLLLTHPLIQVNLRDRDGRTPLHHAADAGSREAVNEVLAQAGVDVNIADVTGKTALHLAVARNSLELIKRFVSYPLLNINAVDETGESALHVAAELGFYDMALSLCREPNINIKLQKVKTAWTPLHLAARKGHDDILQLLLNKCKGIVNGTTVDGYTALHLACIGKHGACVRVLLEEPEIDPNVRTRHGVFCFCIRLPYIMQPNTGSVMV
jgi:ankyrin repeat protein